MVRFIMRVCELDVDGFMPKRQFIGDHEVLRKAVAEEIVKK